ncbi:MAG: hypothetical protein ACFFCV_18835 [Promethearchaeota archaeon]
MEDKKNTIIELIRRYDKKCLDCGKLLLGVTIDIDNSNPDGLHPGAVNIEIKPYPCGCGKCPECAKNCYVGNIERLDKSDLKYNNLVKNVRKTGKIPCDDLTICEFYDIEENDKKKFTDEEIIDFIDSFMENVPCRPYMDKFYFFPEWDEEYKAHDLLIKPKPWDKPEDFLGGKMINLFELIEYKIKNEVN